MFEPSEEARKMAIAAREKILSPYTFEKLMPVPLFQEVHIENTSSCGYKCATCPFQGRFHLKSDFFALLL